ncbi:FAD-dependent oxidoreductase [Nocardia sp. CC201C]|uniref:FAD-dependent oxidoreductase n=1 Tax=Nocardia sp. CC201C TaxID=3044575 RepID=UPI0024A994B3|nr:FAD-dependent oxidoreductase [Nocardia sp. CC201C]
MHPSAPPDLPRLRGRALTASIAVFVALIGPACLALATLTFGSSRHSTGGQAGIAVLGGGVVYMALVWPIAGIRRCHAQRGLRSVHDGNDCGRRVLVVGAGIAGLAAALRFLRDGWEVLVVERAPARRSGGYLVNLHGPGYDAAERMGLVSALAQRDAGSSPPCSCTRTVARS